MEQWLQLCMIFFVTVNYAEPQILESDYQHGGYYLSYSERPTSPVYHRDQYYNSNLQRPGIEHTYYNTEEDPWSLGHDHTTYDSREELHPIYNPHIPYGYRNHVQNRGHLQRQPVVDYREGSDEPHYSVPSQMPQKVSYKEKKNSVEVHHINYNEVIHGGQIESENIKPSKSESDTTPRHSATDPNYFKDMKYVHGVSSKVQLDTAYDINNNYDKICNFMYKNHHQYHMNKAMLEMTCKMYKEWAYNMKTVNEWKPTVDQKNWFDSLSSSEGRRGRRHRRQVNNVPGSRSLRKEYRMMTDEQRYRFHRAVNILKHTFVDGLSMYDVFLRAHQARVAPGAHFGPAFLGYHRELLLRFENALRNIDNGVSLPYWDSNLDYTLGDDLATRSILWTDDFLGNGIGEVTIGPFLHWRLPFPDTSGKMRFLYRNLTVAPPFARTMPALLSDEAIFHMLSATSVRNLSWFVSPVFESHHGAVHNWIGGIMADIPVSPSDPVFYMHHAFLDCLWEQLRSVQKKRNPAFRPQYDYPNDTKALGVGLEQIDGTILNDTQHSYHYALNPMLPFSSLLNIDGYSNIYFKDFYACEPSPICSTRNPSCGSPYLFCERQSQRCAPKLQPGTPCEQVIDSDACFQGVCCNGICQRDCGKPPRNVQNAQLRN